MTNTEINPVYDAVYLLMNAGEWSILNDITECYVVVVENLSIDVLLTWATATLPAKSKLKNRVRFMDACLKFHSSPKDPNLWNGLL
jgi:hypothetical protein